MSANRTLSKSCITKTFIGVVGSVMSTTWFRISCCKCLELVSLQCEHFFDITSISSSSNATVADKKSQQFAYLGKEWIFWQYFFGILFSLMEIRRKSHLRCFTTSGYGRPKNWPNFPQFWPMLSPSGHWVSGTEQLRRSFSSNCIRCHPDRACCKIVRRCPSRLCEYVLHCRWNYGIVYMLCVYH